MRPWPSFPKHDGRFLIDDGNRLAEPMARELYRKGYVLAGWLAGGYPAWAAEPDK